MLGRSKTQKLKDTGASGAELAAALAKDRKFRREVAAAIGHGAKARRSATRQIGAIAVARRRATDERVRRETAEMVENQNSAWGRVEKKRSHRLRNTLLLLGIGGGVAAAASRRQARDLVSTGTGNGPGGAPSPA